MLRFCVIVLSLSLAVCAFPATPPALGRGLVFLGAEKPAATPPNTPRSASSDDVRLLRMERRLKVVEQALADVCGALVYCDDVALLEREACRMGPVFLDGGFSSSRRPLLLRKHLRCVLAQRNIVPTPPMHTWTPVKLFDAKPPPSKL